MEDEASNDAGKTWETPTVTIVALATDVHGGIGVTADEDFTGLPS